jgi:hypothetical protein
MLRTPKRLISGEDWRDEGGSFARSPAEGGRIKRGKSTLRILMTQALYNILLIFDYLFAGQSRSWKSFIMT